MYGSKHRATDGLYESRKDGSGYSSTKREWNLPTHGPNDEQSSNHRKYIRTQSSSNNRVVPSSSSQQQRQNGDKEKKTAKDAKKAIRVHGDWSEFRSSTGKTYFYNCKTEISQWEKPKGWPVDLTSSSARTSTIPASADRSKKETTTNSHSSSTVRSRYKMDDTFLNPRLQQKDLSLSTSIPKLTNFQQQNGDIQSVTSNHIQHDSFQSTQPLTTTSINRLPSPGDDSSRMSFSSTSSKESITGATISNRNTMTSTGNEHNGVLLYPSLSEPAIPVSTPTSDIPLKSFEKHPAPLNGTAIKHFTARSIMPIETSQSLDIEPTTPTISKAERDQEMQKYYRADFIHHLTDWSSTQLEKQCLKLFDDYYGYSAKMSTAFTELKALKSNFRVLEIKRSILTQKLLRCQQHMKERENDKFS